LKEIKAFFLNFLCFSEFLLGAAFGIFFSHYQRSERLGL